MGPYRYRWTEHCFPLGADSLALGEFCTLRPRDRVLDLGCGAGLLLLLCKERERSVSLFGVEIEPRAAELARENLAENGLAGEILTADLRTCPLPRADLVVSNPPYIESAVIETLMPEVRDHEPLAALDGGEDGLFFYRRIIAEAPLHMRRGACLLLEIGCGQGDVVMSLMRDAGFEQVALFQDYAGLDRVVCGTRR